MINLTFGKKVYIFAKNPEGKFLFCNESLAEFAGLDSPVQAIGKTDHDLLWRITADCCRDSDIRTMRGNQFCNVHEKLVRTDGTQKIVREIVMSKFKLLDKDSNCIGVLGSFFDKITNLSVESKLPNITKKSNRVYLGEGFGNVYLTRREYEIFRQIIMGMTIKRIAIKLGISPRTVEAQTNQIKRKLQCKYKNEIPLIAIKYGWIC